MKRHHYLFIIISLLFLATISVANAQVTEGSVCISSDGLKILVSEEVKKSCSNLEVKMNQQTDDTIAKLEGYGYWALGEYENMTYKVTKRIIFIMIASIGGIVTFIFALLSYISTRYTKNYMLILKSDMDEVKQKLDGNQKNDIIQPQKQSVTESKKEMIEVPPPDEPKVPIPKEDIRQKDDTINVKKKGWF